RLSGFQCRCDGLAHQGIQSPQPYLDCRCRDRARLRWCLAHPKSIWRRSPSFSKEVLRSCGFLLGEAVEGAEAPDEIDGVDADDFAGGEAGGDDVECVAVVCIIEGGNEHRSEERRVGKECRSRWSP